jgi:hypothetical protein
MAGSVDPLVMKVGHALPLPQVQDTHSRYRISDQYNRAMRAVMCCNQ